MRGNKKIKAQLSIFRELETQLFTQAERLGIRDRFSALQIKEYEHDAIRQHLIAFYQERANLEYEMSMFGTDKKETLIKLERLEVYIKRAERLAKAYEKSIGKLLPAAGQKLPVSERPRVFVTIGADQ